MSVPEFREALGGESFPVTGLTIYELRQEIVRLKMENQRLRDARVDLFQSGLFTLASGQSSTFKIECDALSGAEWACLAEMLVARLPVFSTVYGVPRGGIRLQKALEPFCTPRYGKRLVVDDVWTTGESMRQFSLSLGFPREGEMGAVIFARSPVEPWVTPLWTLR